MYSSSVEINGITLSMLLRTKENDEESGVKRSAADHWLVRIMQMYSDRAVVGFTGVNHINLVCDGSTHSAQDILVSVCYSRENDVAVYPPPQALSSSKYVSPGEINFRSAIDKLLA